jgi:hypothetical protein
MGVYKGGEVWYINSYLAEKEPKGSARGKKV